VLRVVGEEFLEALTSASASTSLLEGARVRLSRTPSYQVEESESVEPASTP
jgi:hypothetical protein